jgi:hypothetical protein
MSVKVSQCQESLHILVERTMSNLGAKLECFSYSDKEEINSPLLTAVPQDEGDLVVFSGRRLGLN